ncbi:MAG: hypothetical protein SGPRY_013598 [Prymnesium sp.]
MPWIATESHAYIPRATEQCRTCAKKAIVYRYSFILPMKPSPLGTSRFATTSKALRRTKVFFASPEATEGSVPTCHRAGAAALSGRADRLGEADDSPECCRRGCHLASSTTQCQYLRLEPWRAAPSRRSSCGGGWKVGRNVLRPVECGHGALDS